MPVDIEHPDYAYMKPIVRLVRDCSEGDPAVKLRREVYLPADFARQANGEYSDHYLSYLARAYFLGVTSRTKEALVGMVFRKPPTKEIPPAIETLLEDIDGAGRSLDQISKEMVGDLLETGKYYLLVDFPQAEPGIDAEAESRMGLRPTIAPYPFESLINWRFEALGGKQRLTLAVLRESVENTDDEFSHDAEDRYRVLRLRDGVYTQQVYDDSGIPITEEYAPRMAGGATFDHIPLHIVGAKSNLPGKDMPPMYDIARTNIAHYQSTANVKESGYIGTQPMLHVDVGETTLDEWKLHNPGPLSFGNRNGLTTKGGKLEVVQAEATDYNMTTMDKEETQMVMLGARLVQRGGQTETAEAARIEASAEASVLEVVVGNASECIEAALEDVARFLGVDPDGVFYSLNASFWESQLSAQDLQAVMQARQGGTIGGRDVLYMIRNGRIQLDPERTDDQILEESASDSLDVGGAQDLQ